MLQNEAEPEVTGFMVEKALKEALGFSPRGDVYPIGGLPRTEGKAQGCFTGRGEGKRPLGD